MKTDDFTEGVAAFMEKREAGVHRRARQRLHPVQLVVHDDLRRFRLTVLFRLLLALPHLVLATLWLYLALSVAVVNWFVALSRGETVHGLHDWTARCVRYWTQVQAYTWLIADPLPGLSRLARHVSGRSRRRAAGAAGALDDAAPPDPRDPRVRVDVRLRVVLQVVAVIALVRGASRSAACPRGMRDLMAYCLRYQAQTYAYLFLLTSRYPLARRRERLPGRGGLET